MRTLYRDDERRSLFFRQRTISRIGLRAEHEAGRVDLQVRGESLGDC